MNHFPPSAINVNILLNLTLLCQNLSMTIADLLPLLSPHCHSTIKVVLHLKVSPLHHKSKHRTPRSIALYTNPFLPQSQLRHCGFAVLILPSWLRHPGTTFWTPLWILCHNLESTVATPISHLWLHKYDLKPHRHPCHELRQHLHSQTQFVSRGRGRDLGI